MRNITVGLSIAVISFIALAFANASPAVQALIALPGASGLIAALWEIIRSNIEHQHRIEENHAGYAFELSATSHMAEVAFDMHVKFSEKYVRAVSNSLLLLFREGPTTKALDFAGELSDIRNEYMLWQTTDLTEALIPFERALRQIGADQEYLKNVGVGTERMQAVEKVYATFKQIIGLEPLKADASAEIAVTQIIDKLRENLGINQLAKLRKYYIAEATRRMGTQRQ